MQAEKLQHRNILLIIQGLQGKLDLRCQRGKWSSKKKTPDKNAYKTWTMLL